jgi:hypothetical protein
MLAAEPIASHLYVIRSSAMVGPRPKHRLQAPMLAQRCLQLGTRKTWNDLWRLDNVELPKLDCSMFFPSTEVFVPTYLDFPGQIKFIEEGKWISVYESNRRGPTPIRCLRTEIMAVEFSEPGAGVGGNFEQKVAFTPLSGNSDPSEPQTNILDPSVVPGADRGVGSQKPRPGAESAVNAIGNVEVAIEKSIATNLVAIEKSIATTLVTIKNSRAVGPQATPNPPQDRKKKLSRSIVGGEMSSVAKLLPNLDFTEYECDWLGRKISANTGRVINCSEALKLHAIRFAKTVDGILAVEKGAWLPQHGLRQEARSGYDLVC